MTLVFIATYGGRTLHHTDQTSPFGLAIPG